MEEIWPLLAATMELPIYNIATPRCAAGLIGTISHEAAGQFYPIHEFGTPADWAGYGGGAAYAGRGLIQNTHIGNYIAIQDFLRANFPAQYGDLDLVANPDGLLDPAISCHAACLYWIQHGGFRLIANYCEQENWAEVRRLVYGAYDPPNAAKMANAWAYLKPIAQAAGAA